MQQSFSNNSNEKWIRFCDEILKPLEIETVSHIIDLKFQSKNEPENHFWLSYSTIGKL